MPWWVSAVRASKAWEPIQTLAGGANCEIDSCQRLFYKRLWHFLLEF
jgi:hypothetical protein